MPTKSLAITLLIDEDLIRRAVGSARIVYWGADTEWEDRDAMRLRVVEDEPTPGAPSCVVVDRDGWARGLVVMATLFPDRFAELLSKRGDETTGDLLIQCAAFGEERYG